MIKIALQARSRDLVYITAEYLESQNKEKLPGPQILVFFLNNVISRLKFCLKVILQENIKIITES